MSRMNTAPKSVIDLATFGDHDLEIMIPMRISRLQLLMHFCMWSRALHAEQGRLAGPAIPPHGAAALCTVPTGKMNAGRLGFDEAQDVQIRRQGRSSYQHADDTMHYFVRQKNQI